MTALFSTILILAWQGGLLALIGMFVRYLLLDKIPKWSICLLWLLVGLRLLFPFSFRSTASFMTDTLDGVSFLDRWQHSYVGETHTYYENTPEYDQATSAGIYPFHSGDSRYVITGQTVEQEPSTVETAVFPILIGIWLFGVFIMFSYFGFSYLRIKIQLKKSRWDGEVYISDRIRSPFVFGIFNPVIYLPSHLEDKYIPLILAHEHVHIMRFDFLWKPFAFFLLSIYWFHPILWIAYILLNRDIEAACDEMVVRNMTETERADYSRALVSCAVKEKWISACPIAFGENGVSARIKAILNYKKPAFAMRILAIFLIGFLSFGFLTKYSEMPGFSLQTYSFERISRTDRYTLEDISAVAVQWHDADFNSHSDSIDEMTDEAEEALLDMLSQLRFRSNYRSMIPWRIHQYSDKGGSDTATVVLDLSDNRFCSLWISTSGLVEVDAEDTYKMGMIFYNLVDKKAAKSIVEFLKTQIVD